MEETLKKILAKIVSMDKRMDSFVIKDDLKKSDKKIWIQ